jgi:hypothetical protein
MVTLSFIRRHLSTLKEGELITTRDLLYAGPRREVDYAISKCIRDGWIERVARGVFVRTILTFIVPTLEQVAEVKAKSFGRDLRVNGYTTAIKEGLVRGPLRDNSFHIDGSSSSFVFMNETTVHFRKASKKIMRLTDQSPGLAVRAAMAVGFKHFTAWHFEKLKPLWSSRPDLSLLCNSKQWMHAWLGDLFQALGYCGPGKQVLAADVIDEPDYLSYKEWCQRRLDNGLLGNEGNSDGLDFWSGEGDDLPEKSEKVSAQGDELSKTSDPPHLDFEPPVQDLQQSFEDKPVVEDLIENFDMRTLGWSLEDVFDDIQFSDDFYYDDSL